jgi:topoisomerase IA-like protein
MTYKIVKNADGEVIAYGLDNGMYEPSLRKGDVLDLVEDNEAQPLIEAYHAKIEADRVTNEAAKSAAKAELLERLGITEDEAKLLLA